jgi:hypothetical protein
MEFGLDGTLEAAKYYSGMSDGIDPRGLTLTQDSFNYHTDIYVAGVQISAGKSGAFLTSCDGNYSVEHQNAWFGSSNASVNKIMFGAANDVYLAGFMPGLDAGSTYGMLWRFSTADGSLLSSEYWGNGTHRGAFYNLGWYQSGMLLMGVADDVNATWNTLIGNTRTPRGSWSDYFGALVTTSLSVDSIAGAVSDFTGYTKDTGGGGFDALMMWRTMS